MAPGAAEAFEPADQVAGRNMPRDRFRVQRHQRRQFRHADGGATGKGGLDGAGQGGRIRGQGAGGGRHGVASHSIRCTRSPRISARPASTRRSTTLSDILRVPKRQPLR